MPRLASWRWSSFGAGSSTGTEPGVEVVQRLLETDLCRVELTHRNRESVLGEVVRLDTTSLCDQLHRSHRRPVMPVREHVYVRVGHSPSVHAPRRLSELAIRHAPRLHERPKRLAKRLCAVATHRQLL